MMGGVSPETCWASYKYEIKILIHCCILLDFLFELLLQGQLCFIRWSTLIFCLPEHFPVLNLKRFARNSHLLSWYYAKISPTPLAWLATLAPNFPHYWHIYFLPIHFSIDTHQNLPHSNWRTMFLQNVRLRHLRQAQGPKWTTTDE